MRRRDFKKAGSVLVWTVLVIAMLSLIAVETLRLSWRHGEDDLLYGEQSPSGKAYRAVTQVDGERFRAAWLDAVCRV